LSSDDAVRAYNQPLSLIPLKTLNEVRAPHWSVYVRQLLEDKYGAQDLYRLGLTVTTTLDLDWQMAAERIAKTQIDKLKAQNASNAALLALDAGTGEIKAMLGSVDFFNKEIDGQVNVTLRQRQPGSSIKPVTYVAAFEKGWTPATLILDNPSKFPDKPNPDYEPRNYDGKFHGFVTARDALANSYNIPAVKTLNFVGLPDMIKMAERLGIKSFTRKDYGLSLTLGGGDVTLFELTAAYAVFANQGKRATPVSILKITDGTGKVLQEFKPAPAPEVVKSQYAYMLTDILEDNAARTPAFGPNSVLKLSRPAAVKTGTTNDSRDNWTVGYTADNLVVGVWVGNNNNKAMIGTSGISGAAPIWHDFIEEVAKGKPAKQFPSVPDMVLQYICSDTGFLANDLCPHKRPEVFFKSNVPPGDFVYRRYLADRLTGQVYDERCPVNLKEERTAAAFADQEFRQWAASAWQFRAGFTAADFYKGDELRDWANDHGVPQPPKLLKASLTQPLMNNSAQGLIDLIGSVDIPDFASYITEYGVGDDPIGWGTVSPSNSTKVTNSVLAQWDSAAVPNGVYSLRVVATDKKGNKAESCTRVLVLNPTPAPTATPAFTFTPTPTTTPTPTRTPTPTPTASTTVTPAPTRTPTSTLSCVPLGGGLLTPIPTLDIRCASPTPASTQTAVPTPTATPKP
ncbi:MAG: hypothetical protein HYR71_02645, partial [Chloroflexi bacterium]|nr:hypothetical protein [Chloroflexota bacterium]